jgi:photosystem II stability/assembly factor-like uncharacterized protein
MLLGLLYVLAVSSTTALAAPASISPNDNQPFSKQMRIGFQAGDDWEPAIASDRYGHTYALYKHYDMTGGQTCSGCNLHLLVQRSSDGGRSWTKPRPIAPGTVKGGQYDPQIMVDPVDGRTVWASFLQNSKSLIAVVKSTDFGETWSAPMLASSRPPGLDKDELAVRGNTVVVAYDDNFNTWISISLNGGKTWTTREVFQTSFLFSISLAAGAAIDSRGNIFISWGSFDKAHRKNGDGPSTLWVSKSSDNGNSWSRTVIETSGAPPPCNNCGYSFLGAQMALRVGSDDTVYLLWNSTVGQKDFAPERIFFSRSTDHGKSYSPRVGISDAPNGVEHAFPTLATGNSPGDVRLAWMDKRTGMWNVFYRSSADSGGDFSATVRISGYVPGYAYLTWAGFGSPYGDYMSMVVSSDNIVQMAFGEGPNYQGPGNIWVSHSLDD